MKKFIITFLILLSFFLNAFKIPAKSQSNVFREGVYKVSDLKILESNRKFIENVSENEMFIQVFDNNRKLLQAISLVPKSSKFTLYPLKEDYTIVLVGDGQVYFS